MECRVRLYRESRTGAKTRTAEADPIACPARRPQGHSPRVRPFFSANRSRGDDGTGIRNLQRYAVTAKAPRETDTSGRCVNTRMIYDRRTSRRSAPHKKDGPQSHRGRKADNPLQIVLSMMQQAAGKRRAAAENDAQRMNETILRGFRYTGTLSNNSADEGGIAQTSISRSAFIVLFFGAPVKMNQRILTISLKDPS